MKGTKKARGHQIIAATLILGLCSVLMPISSNFIANAKTPITSVSSEIYHTHQGNETDGGNCYTEHICGGTIVSTPHTSETKCGWYLTKGSLAYTSNGTNIYNYSCSKCGSTYRMSEAAFSSVSRCTKVTGTTTTYTYACEDCGTSYTAAEYTSLNKVCNHSSGYELSCTIPEDTCVGTVSVEASASNSTITNEAITLQLMVLTEFR